MTSTQGEKRINKKRERERIIEGKLRKQILTLHKLMTQQKEGKIG